MRPRQDATPVPAAPQFWQPWPRCARSGVVSRCRSAREFGDPRGKHALRHIGLSSAAKQWLRNPARSCCRRSSAPDGRDESRPGTVRRLEDQVSSRQHKGKLCVYCSARPATTGDHIFAREFFPIKKRGNLPQAPTCDRCNTAKSKLEGCLTTVLPFGAMRSYDGNLKQGWVRFGRRAPAALQKRR